MIAIGVDVGGTSIKGTAVDETGKVYDKFVLPINNNLSHEDMVIELRKTIKTYIKDNDLEKEISGIGIGIPGSIDSKNGIVSYGANLHWKDLPIVKILQEELPYAVKITNDANAATFGETVFGAGRKYKNVVMFTLGTGVGGGVVIDGKLFEGNQGKGTELGHITLVKDGVECCCGRKGCFECYASATGLIRMTKEEMELNKESLMWQLVKDNNGKVDGKIAFDAAKKGDISGQKVVDLYVSYLGEGILNYANIFRPECFILSGGVANQGEYLTSRLFKYCEERNFGYLYAPKSEIITAELGYESGIVGAACLILKGNN